MGALVYALIKLGLYREVLSVSTIASHFKLLARTTNSI